MECPICKLELSKIDSQHLRKHGLSKDEYFYAYGKDAPFGYSAELKAKKSGKNHPGFGKSRSQETKDKVAKGVKKLWDDNLVTEKQKNGIGERSKLAAENGEHFNKGRTHERSDEYRKKLSSALIKYHANNFGKSKQIYQKHWEQTKWKIANTRKNNTFKKYYNELSGWAKLNSIENNIVKLTCNTCNNDIFVQSQTILKHKYQQTLCHRCFPIFRGTSKLEDEVYCFLNEILQNTSIIRHCKTILNGLELDFFIPKFNIALEFNGIYWHSENAGYSKDKHLIKTELCESKNIQLIHIFENEWLLQNELVKARLRNKFNKCDRIFGRQCTIVQISNKAKKEFLNVHHLQGDCISKFNYGLLFNDELVAIMTFGKPRFNKNFDYELLRFAVKQNLVVVGGASKLFKAFTRDNPSGSILSYADRRWNTGGIYKHLGFELYGKSSPSFWVFKNNLTLLHRTHFQKHKLSNLLENYDENLSAWENLLNHKYNRIWDSGTLIFHYIPK